MKKIGDILSGFFDEETMQKAKGYSALFSSWEGVTAACALPAAAAHSRVATLERGMLVIEAEHPVWIQLLQTKQRELLHVMRTFSAVELNGISFKLMKPDPLN
ncbi:MAG: DUF721 domain-containing protein [Treponema sp.]|jgi:predicted nucleic acid-binding Zn ribbon protein|nr:DUF721 domain-containing protein [Treponema sp.]